MFKFLDINFVTASIFISSGAPAVVPALLRNRLGGAPAVTMIRFSRCGFNPARLVLQHARFLILVIVLSTKGDVPSGT